MTHAKAILADNAAILDPSSFNEFLARDLAEICLATDGPSLVTQLEKLLRGDMAKSLYQN